MWAGIWGSVPPLTPLVVWDIRTYQRHNFWVCGPVGRGCARRVRVLEALRNWLGWGPSLSVGYGLREYYFPSSCPSLHPVEGAPSARPSFPCSLLGAAATLPHPSQTWLHALLDDRPVPPGRNFPAIVWRRGARVCARTVPASWPVERRHWGTLGAVVAAEGPLRPLPSL